MKKLFSIFGALVLALMLTTPAHAASMSVVSDETVDVVGVYNKSGDDATLVPASAKAVIAVEPTTYPTDFSAGATNSVWDNGTGLYFQNASPVAEWIWDTERVEDASTLSDPLLADPDASSNGRVVVFEKTFTINGTPQDSVMRIAADNGWEVFVNGTSVGKSASAKVDQWYLTDLKEGSLGSTGWQTVGLLNIPAASLNDGSNTIRVYAGNE